MQGRVVLARLSAALISVTIVNIAWSDEPPGRIPAITVTGTAIAEVAPDRMIWCITVTNRGYEVEKVAQEHTLWVQSVLKVAHENQVAKADVQTSNMALGVHFEGDGEKRKRDGYFASTELVFTSKQLAKYPALWIGLAKASGVTVDRIAFDHSQRLRYQEETREQAVKTARDKARKMALALECNVAEPLLIEEQEESSGLAAGNHVRGVTIGADDSGTAGSGLAPGKLRIRSSVRVTFRLKPRDAAK